MSYRFPIEEIGKHPSAIPVKCFQCDKWFAVRPHAQKKYKKLFCSNECFSATGEKKTCLSCKKIMLKSYFPKASHTKSGVYSYCMDCCNKRSREKRATVEYKEKLKYWDRQCEEKGCRNISMFQKTKCVLHGPKRKNQFELTDKFKNNQAKFSDKIVDYAESPTGKAYIGVAKRPLMRAADNGHGYQGVLLQDNERKLVQCASCGGWYKHISGMHLKSCSGMNHIEYKTKYGLPRTTGLVSDAMSEQYTKQLLTGIKPGFHTANKKYSAAGAGHRNYGKTMEAYNRQGTCPLQVEAKIVDFINRNKEFPRSGNKGRLLAQLVSKRYGTFRDAMINYGLPYPVSYGALTKYVFPNSKELLVDYRDINQRDQLYQMMKKHCPILSKTYN